MQAMFAGYMTDCSWAGPPPQFYNIVTVVNQTGCIEFVQRCDQPSKWLDLDAVSRGDVIVVKGHACVYVRTGNRPFVNEIVAFNPRTGHHTLLHVCPRHCRLSWDTPTGSVVMRTEDGKHKRFRWMQLRMTWIMACCHS
jgi:hypothetical protein